MALGFTVSAIPRHAIVGTTATQRPKARAQPKLTLHSGKLAIRNAKLSQTTSNWQYTTANWPNIRQTGSAE
ncbi:hypothetical protein [uncultured Acetobacteroides sp.]|uniref:hypothetical protein n=1 Tax=uncultured Acetobacteroides sp. TaxID=1760811 RepID=UPI0029F5868F|nr:hypothetical protein [uncultured Acetobacteroides sp.]